MRRRAGAILVLLVAGTITNVLVAWACAMWSPVSAQASPDAAWEWFGASHRSELHHFEVYGARVGRGPARRRVEVSGWVHPLPGFRTYVEDRSGWPLPALSGDILFVESAVSRTRGAIVLEASGDPALLPLAPLWPAFAVNSLVYAMLLLVVVGGTRQVRAARRRRRNRCPSCAYPIGPSPVCTECGISL